MEHEDRPLGRHPVEVLAGEAGFVAEVDRVEAADHDRFVGAGRRRVELAQTIEQPVVRPDAGGDPAVHPVAVEPPDVRQQGERALQRVGVGLDHAGHDDVVGETPVDRVRPPTRALVERPGGEDPSVTDGDGLDDGLRRVHRDDGAGREDRDHVRSGATAVAIEVEVVEVGEVEDLQVDALRAGVAPAHQSRGDLVGRAGGPVRRATRRAPGRSPRRVGRRSASSSPQHTTSAAENVMVAGSRSIDSHAARTRSHCWPKKSTLTNGVLNSAAKRAASAGVRFGPPPPITIGNGVWSGLVSAGESVTG